MDEIRTDEDGIKYYFVESPEAADQFLQKHLNPKGLFHGKSDDIPAIRDLSVPKNPSGQATI